MSLSDGLKTRALRMDFYVPIVLLLHQFFQVFMPMTGGHTCTTTVNAVVNSPFVLNSYFPCMG